MADMNHLVMLHGMTGTSSKMRPLAESLAPHNWGVVCPEGTYSASKKWTCLVGSRRVD